MPWVYGNHYSGHWEGGNRFNRVWIQNPLPDLEWRDDTSNNPLPNPNQLPSANSSFDSVITTIATAGLRIPIIYGKVRTGGIVIYEKSDNAGGWYSVYLIGWGPIKSITNITMGTEPIATFNPYTTNIYLGNSTTNATFDTILNAVDSTWTSRLPGLAYVMIHFRNPNQVTDGKQPDPHSFICDVEGLYVPNHTLDSTFATLYYTESPALAKNDHWTNKRYGGGIPVDTIDYTTVDQAATDCAFVLSNGSPRFKIGIKLGPDVHTWTENDKLLGLHGQIWCSTSQGLRQMFVDGDQTASSIIITDVGANRNILTASFRLLEPEEVFNHFEFSYTDQVNQFKPGSAITEDPGIGLGTIYQVLPANYDTHGSPSFDQSKRLSVWAFNGSRLDKEYFFDVLYDGGVKCVPGLVVTVTSADVDVTNQLMIVRLVEDIDDLSFKITCRLFDHTIFSDVPQTTFASAPPAGVSPYGPLPAPTGFSISSSFDLTVPYVNVVFTPYIGINAGGTRITKQVGGGTIVDEGVFLSSPIKLVTPDSLNQLVTIKTYSVDINTGQSGSLFATGTTTPTVPVPEPPGIIYKSSDGLGVWWDIPPIRDKILYSAGLWTKTGSIDSVYNASKLNDGDLTVSALVWDGIGSGSLTVDVGSALQVREIEVTWLDATSHPPINPVYSSDNITLNPVPMLGTGTATFGQAFPAIKGVQSESVNGLRTVFYIPPNIGAFRYWGFNLTNTLNPTARIAEIQVRKYTGSNYLFTKGYRLFGQEPGSSVVLNVNSSPVRRTININFQPTDTNYIKKTDWAFNWAYTDPGHISGGNFISGAGSLGTFALLNIQTIAINDSLSDDRGYANSNLVANAGGSSLPLDNPLMDGIVTPGISTIPTPIDHVHPTDTSLISLANLPSVSVDNEVVLFSSTTGKILKRATGNGIAKIVSGVLSLLSKLGLADGGTHTDLSGTGGTHQVLQQSTVGGDITVSQLATTDISGLGTWSTVTFAAGNFSSDTGTWMVTSGEQTTYAYTVFGKTMTLSFCIFGGVVAGTPPAYLSIAIPGGFTGSSKDMRSTFYYSDDGAVSWHDGMVIMNGGSIIKLYRDPAPTHWAAATTYVLGQITFEIT